MVNKHQPVRISITEPVTHIEEGTGATAPGASHLGKLDFISL